MRVPADRGRHPFGPRRRRPRLLLRALAVCGAAAAVAAVVASLVTTTDPDTAPAPGGLTDGRAPGPVHQVRVDRLDGARTPHTGLGPRTRLAPGTGRTPYEGQAPYAGDRKGT